MGATLLAKYGTYEEELMGHVESITAHVGGGQGSATALTAKWNQIDTCATDGNSCLLVVSKKGHKQTVFNNTAHTAAIFPQVGEKINGVVNVSVSIGPGQTGVFECSKDGEWFCYASSSNIVYTATLNLTSVNILTLNSTPLQIVPAAAGLISEVIGGAVSFTKGSILYNSGSGPVIYTPNGASTAYQANSAQNFTFASSFFLKLQLLGGDVKVNSPIMVKSPTADYTSGNGTAKIYVSYLQYAP